VRYPERESHARVIEAEAARVRSDFARRAPVLGVDPQMVVVLETNRQLDPDDVERAGLRILEFAGDTALVAFSNDPDLQEFRRQLEEYSRGTRGLTAKGNVRAAMYEALFDAVERIRALAPNDVVTRSLADELAAGEVGRTLRIEIHCWCPEDEADARQRMEQVTGAVVEAGGRILDSSLRVRAGLSVIVAEISASEIQILASTDRVRRIDLRPRPMLSHPQLRSVSAESLPPVMPSSATAPRVGIIDSGVRAGHPLIAPALVSAEYVDPRVGDAGDQTGHGTLVASLALYGSLEAVLADRQPLVPAGGLVSVKVLDHHNNFPDDRVWEEHLLRAMEIAADAGSRVINISLGDQRNAYRGPRPTALGAIIDDFARRRNVIVVISAGNYPPAGLNIESLLAREYPADLLNSPDAGLLDPAPAALALTVGALCADLTQGADVLQSRQAEVLPVGSPGAPSPLTRVGPGVMNSIKPDLVAPGGSIAVDSLMSRVTLRERAVQVVGAGGIDAGQILASDAGTSFSAPLVSHAALRVLSRYPRRVQSPQNPS
jgi:Subtilase family